MTKSIHDFINGKVTYDRDGQYFWINTPKNGMQMLGELRGWGHIQNMFKHGEKFDLESAAKFQDQVGEFVAEAINAKIELEKEFKI